MTRFGMLGNWEVNLSMLEHLGQTYNPTCNGAGFRMAAAMVGVAPTGSGAENLLSTAGAITDYSRLSVLPGCSIAGNPKSLTPEFTPTCSVNSAPHSAGSGYGFGDDPKDGLRSIWFGNVDFALLIAESKTIQLRHHGFNMFNHMRGEVPTSIAVTSVPAISPTLSGSAGQLQRGLDGSKYDQHLQEVAVARRFQLLTLTTHLSPRGGLTGSAR